nr:hypothetical transcript [Hymenolepis microstoma]
MIICDKSRLSVSQPTFEDYGRRNEIAKTDYPIQSYPNQPVDRILIVQFELLMRDSEQELRNEMVSHILQSTLTW